MATPLNFGLKKTLSPANQFHFTCPVFGVETAIATCFKLRDMVWMGKKPAQRQGCQACMAADRCPINGIIKDMVRSDSDPYHAAEKKVGVLRADDVGRVANIRVLDFHLRNFAVPPRELELIQEANDRASAAGAAKTARDQAPTRKREKVTLDAVEVDPKSDKPTVDATTAAAIAGDMSAAINAAMKATEPAPAPAPVAPKPTPAPITGAKPLSLLERARLAKEGKAA